MSYLFYGWKLGKTFCQLVSAFLSTLFLGFHAFLLALWVLQANIRRLRWFSISPPTCTLHTLFSNSFDASIFTPMSTALARIFICCQTTVRIKQTLWGWKQASFAFIRNEIRINCAIKEVSRIFSTLRQIPNSKDPPKDLVSIRTGTDIFAVRFHLSASGSLVVLQFHESDNWYRVFRIIHSQSFNRVRYNWKWSSTWWTLIFLTVQGGKMNSNWRIHFQIEPHVHVLCEFVMNKILEIFLRTIYCNTEDMRPIRWYWGIKTTPVCQIFIRISLSGCSKSLEESGAWI